MCVCVCVFAEEAHMNVVVGSATFVPRMCGVYKYKIFWYKKIKLRFCAICTVQYAKGSIFWREIKSIASMKCISSEYLFAKFCVFKTHD